MAGGTRLQSPLQGASAHHDHPHNNTSDRTTKTMGIHVLGEGEGMMLGKVCPRGKEHREVNDVNAMPLPALLLLQRGQLRGRKVSKRRSDQSSLKMPTFIALHQRVELAAQG